MEYFLQQKLLEDKKFKRYFEENTNYVKYLNRDPEYYKEFMHEMKKVYQERPTDKLNDAINTINVVSSIIDTLK